MIKVTNFKIINYNGEPLSKVKYKEAPINPQPKVQIVDFHKQDELSVSEFANEALITPQAVRKMISESRLTATKTGNQYIIPKEELIRYLQNR